MAMAQKLSTQLTEERKIMLGVQLYDLLSKTEAELNAIPNFGQKSIDEVVDTLAARGMHLRQD